MRWSNRISGPVLSLATVMTPAATRPLPSLLGIGLAALSFALFSVMDTAAKWLSGRYPLFEVSFLSAAFALPTILVLGGRRRMVGALRTRRRRLHLLRALLGASGGYCAFYAYSTMPLADAYAIAFAAPLFITALSGPLLGERVGRAGWGAVAAGFLGVLVMMRPGTGMLCPGAFAALAGALLYALSMTLVRRMGSSEHSTSFALFGCLISLAISGLVMLPDFVVPGTADLGLSALSGIVGGTAAICMMIGFSRTPAAVVAPFQYTQLLWGALAGYVLWGHTPDLWLGIGASLVIASGLSILCRETLRPAAAAPVLPRQRAVRGAAKVASR